MKISFFKPVLRKISSICTKSTLWAGIFSVIGVLVSCTPNQVTSNHVDNDDLQLSGEIVLWVTFPQNYLTESLTSTYKKVLSRYIENFVTLYPDIKIITKFVPFEELVSSLEHEVDKGLGPDLIYAQSTNLLSLIRAQTILPIRQDVIDPQQFRTQALEQVSYRGKIYGFPVDLDTQSLCYHKQKVKELPQTLSELIEQARKGYSVGILSRYEDTLWGTQIFGEQLLDQRGRVNLKQIEAWGWARWMTWLKGVKSEPNFILNENPQALENAFVEEKLAYHVCWSSQIPYLKELLGNNKFGVALLPGVNQTQLNQTQNRRAAPPLIVNALLFSSASSKTQNNISLRFAQFFTNIQQQTQITVQLQAIIPANKNVSLDSRLFPIQAVLQAQSKNSMQLRLEQLEKIQASSNFSQALYAQVMAGAKPPEEAAIELAQLINSLSE
ncbi:MAG: extracellular solute-binding protein [Cyanobacteria bacterium P01_H01_bin.15]